jgi:hypothetical protein
MQDKYVTSSFELAAFIVLEVTLMLLKRYGYLFAHSSKKRVFVNDYLRLVGLFPNVEAIITHYLTMKRDLNTIVNKLFERSYAISTPGSLNREERRHTNGKLAWI